MRCYHFGNYYMSSIQQGIQAAHCQMELFVKYQDIGINHDYDYLPAINGIEYQIKVDNLYDWAENHKTMICLNGGNLQGLKDIESLFQSEQNIFPWATFYEDEMSLGGILTNVCIVIPEDIYETASKIRTGDLVQIGNKLFDKYCTELYNPARAKIVLNDFEIKLIQILNSCQLAK